MLSTKNRLLLQEICNRIKNKQDVSLDEMVLMQKFSRRYSCVNKWFRQAQRIAFQGPPAKGSLDELLQDLDLGDPDPKNHLAGPLNPAELGLWFRRRDETDRLRRD